MRDILDNDLYKFTQQNAVLKLFPEAEAEYTFINRGGTQFPPGFGERVSHHLSNFGEHSLSSEQKTFIGGECPYFLPDYLDFLEDYRYNPDEVEIGQKGTDLSVKMKGLWHRSILWEVPLMGLISELYFGKGELFPDVAIMPPINDDRDIEKARKFEALGVGFVEFGTRRRHSFFNQNRVISILKTYAKNTFMGTSNLSLAMEHGLKAFGTQAHEWFMAMAAIYGYLKANEMALANWRKVYDSDLSVALTDTYTTDNFFQSFSKWADYYQHRYAHHFDVRHDSADALVFADKTISFYEDCEINPKDKMIMFSDGLNYDEGERIHNHCGDRIKHCFGIGTNFTNDIEGIKPLNIVIKMTRFRLSKNDPWVGTVKLSDVEGKNTGHPDDVKRCKESIEGVFIG